MGFPLMHRRNFLAASAAAVAGLGPLSSAAFAAESGVSDTEIVLGHTGILSGPLGAPIKVVMAGAGLAFDAVNAQGGLSGRKIKLVSLDDELKPEKAVANYEKLLSEHRAFAFFGCVGSGTTAAAAKVLNQSGAPHGGRLRGVRFGARQGQRLGPTSCAPLSRAKRRRWCST
jgi:branched-chain amino acid transport system substrate-binding protein